MIFVCCRSRIQLSAFLCCSQRAPHSLIRAQVMQAAQKRWVSDCHCEESCDAASSVTPDLFGTGQEYHYMHMAEQTRCSSQCAHPSLQSCARAPTGTMGCCTPRLLLPYPVVTNDEAGWALGSSIKPRSVQANSEQDQGFPDKSPEGITP